MFHVYCLVSTVRFSVRIHNELIITTSTVYACFEFCHTRVESATKKCKLKSLMQADSETICVDSIVFEFTNSCRLAERLPQEVVENMQIIVRIHRIDTDTIASRTKHVYISQVRPEIYIEIQTCLQHKQDSLWTRNLSRIWRIRTRCIRSWPDPCWDRNRFPQLTHWIW